jgi:hypothetical protein
MLTLLQFLSPVRYRPLGLWYHSHPQYAFPDLPSQPLRANELPSSHPHPLHDPRHPSPQPTLLRRAADALPAPPPRADARPGPGPPRLRRRPHWRPAPPGRAPLGGAEGHGRQHRRVAGRAWAVGLCRRQRRRGPEGH